jgi:hypothetical protein
MLEPSRKPPRFGNSTPEVILVSALAILLAPGGVFGPIYFFYLIAYFLDVAGLIRHDNFYGAVAIGTAHIVLAFVFFGCCALRFLQERAAYWASLSLAIFAVFLIAVACIDLFPKQAPDWGISGTIKRAVLAVLLMAVIAIPPFLHWLGKSNIVTRFLLIGTGSIPALMGIWYAIEMIPYGSWDWRILPISIAINALPCLMLILAGGKLIHDGLKG